MVEATRYDKNLLFSERAIKQRPSFVRQMLALLQEHPEIISFAGGLPDPETMPTEEMFKCQQLPIDLVSPEGKAIAEKHLKQLGLKRFAGDLKRELNYCATTGRGHFKGEMVKLLKELTGVEYGKDEILVCNAGQQGISLMARAFLNPHDVVYTYGNTYVGAIPAFELVGAVKRGIPVDKRGIVIDKLVEDLERTVPNPDLSHKVRVPGQLSIKELEEIIEREKSIVDKDRRGKMVYINAFYDNPNQTVLPRERAEKLVKLAYKYNLVIFEDEPYGEVGFLDGEFKHDGLPYLNKIGKDMQKGLGESSNPVLFLFTISKIIFPGSRLAVLAGDAEFIDKIQVIEQADSLCPSTKAQAEVATYLMNYDIAEHIDILRRGYKAKGDLFESELQKTKHLWPLIEGYNRGPLFFFITFKPGVAVSEMFTEENILKYGVMAVPGKFCGDETDLTVRSNQGFASPDQIKEGLKRWDRLAEDLYPSKR